MKHRVLSFILANFMLLSTLAFPAFAASTQESTNHNIISFEDGSCLISTITEINTRSTGAKSGKNTITFRNSDGEVKWQAVLSASFTYNGTTATCTSAKCTLTIYDDAWYQVSRSTSRSGNTATTLLTMGHKIFGITISKPSYTITLSCDANGNLS